MQKHFLDLSPLSSPLQQELIDFYEFLLEKQAKNKEMLQTDLTIPTQTRKGFAMLKTKRTAVPADFDPASLFEHDRT